MDMQLLSAGDDIRLWDSQDFILTRQLNPHNQNVADACWAPDNKFLASVSVHTEEVVLTYTKKQETATINCGAGCACIDINDTSRYMLTGAADGIISVWDLKTKKIRKSYKDHKGPVTCARFNQGTTVIASGSETGEIILYNVVTGQGCRPLKTPVVQAVKQVQYSHFKKSLLGSVSDDGGVNLWDCNTRQLIHNFSSHRAPATGLSFSPVNNIFLMSVGLDKRITCHDVQSNEIVKVINTDSPLTSVDILHDGYTVVVGTTRGRIYHYDLRMTSGLIHTLDAHRSSVQALRFQVHDKSELEKSSRSVKQSNKPRHLPQSPEANREVLSPKVSNIKSMNECGGGVDVFSPLREGYPSQSEEELSHSANYNINNNSSSQNYNSYNGSYNSFSHKTASNGNSYTEGVFSPVNDGLGRSSSGAPISPLAFPGYTSTDQYQPISTLASLDQYRNTSQGTSVVQTSNGVDYHQSLEPVASTSLPGRSPQSLASSEMYPQTSNSAIDHHSVPLPTPTNKKHVAFKTDEAETLAPSHSGGSSINSDYSPNLRHQQQVGVSASPSFSSMHFDESPGSVSGGGVGFQLHPPTPEGVNAQSGANSDDVRSTISATRLTSHTSDRSDTSVGVGRKAMMGVDATMIAEIVRGVVQEEMSVMKKEMRKVVREELEDMTYELHKDIITLQAEMLLQFQSHQEDVAALLQHYSINQDLVAEVERLKEELKRYKSYF